MYLLISERSKHNNSHLITEKRPKHNNNNNLITEVVVFVELSHDRAHNKRGMESRLTRNHLAQQTACYTLHTGEV